jgi:hypothetical protein
MIFPIGLLLQNAEIVEISASGFGPLIGTFHFASYHGGKFRF